MKNIAVFAVLVIIFFTISPAVIFCQHSMKLPAIEKDTSYTFSINPLAGFVYGQALEFVYQVPKINNAEFISKLTWDMKPVFYLGLGFDYGKTDISSSIGFYAAASFKAGIPAVSGFLENRDWLSYEHSNLTNFSKHTLKTNEFFGADIAAGISIPVHSYFYIIPFISGSWMRFSFLGYDGYGEYPEKPQDNYVDYTGQKIHTYKQDWFIGAFGITLGTKIPPPFSFYLSFKISPLTYCIAYDEHLGGVKFPSGSVSKLDTYLDYTRFGLYAEPGCGVSYSIKKIDFSIDLSYRHISNTDGITYVNGGPAPVYGSGGAGLSLLDLKISLKIRV